MEPKMVTFRGPAEKLKSEPGIRENPVEAVPGGSQNRSEFDAFSEGPSGGSFFRSRRPKKAAKADFRVKSGRIGVLIGLLFRPNRRFFGGLHLR